MDFHIGDVVTLKSGGPRMTVTGISHLIGGTSITCRWFTTELNLVERGFTPDSLTKVNGDDVSHNRQNIDTDHKVKNALDGL